jgi:hypothetical protein
MNCLKCLCNKNIKAGFTKEKQRYKCKGCDCNYTVKLKPIAKPEAMKEQALHLCLESLGFRLVETNRISKCIDAKYQNFLAYPIQKGNDCSLQQGNTSMSILCKEL